MKVLLVYMEHQDKVASKIKSSLEKAGILTDNFPISAQQEGRREEERRFSAFFHPFVADIEETAPQGIRPSHVLVLSALASGWIDFLAGFASGSHIPFAVFGLSAIKSIPEQFTSFLKPLKTIAELHDYLVTEYRLFKKMEENNAAQIARENLLKVGIPVNDKSFVQCVHNGDISEVLFFLAAGFSPDTLSETGVPLLCVAARTGNSAMLRLLYLAGAQINLQSNDRGNTALIDSVMGNHLDFVVDLIKAGADVNVTSKSGQTALVVAVGANDTKIAEALLKAGADPDISDALGASARKYAAMFHNADMMALFDTYAPKSE